MKKIIMTAAVVALSAGAAFAEPTASTTPGKIVNSKHDLNFTKAGNSEKGEICIYCHTPHNALINVPLWNRKNPTPTAFTLYNSPTLTDAAKASALTTSSISLFCMSCHDGITGLGDVQNRNSINVPSNTYGIQTSTGATVATNTVIATASSENAALGRGLGSTHPVGFDFTSVPGADSGINGKQYIIDTFNNKKRPALAGKYAEATTAQDFLYGTANNMFECASCHRVHDPGTSGNFLRIENDRSQLCLACHNK